MAAPAADDEDYEICNDDGFVYKRRRGLYPDVPPTSVLPAGPDPVAVLRRRRRRALRHLLEERRRELASWEALEGELASLEAQPPPPQAPTASLGAAATDDQSTSSSAPAIDDPSASSASPCAAATVVPPAYSLLDDIHAHLEVREEIVKKLDMLCKQFKELCSARIASWPVWADPMELGSLESPDAPDEILNVMDKSLQVASEQTGQECFSRQRTGPEADHDRGRRTKTRSINSLREHEEE